jgi:hypothetical protein
VSSGRAFPADLATHPFVGRKAAVEVLRREVVEDRGLVERFMNEARAANAIHHPNTVRFPLVAPDPER